MMPSLPLVRARREDKTSDLERFVRAEYREDGAGWLSSGLELQAGVTLPCSRSICEGALSCGRAAASRCEDKCCGAEAEASRS